MLTIKRINHPSLFALAVQSSFPSALADLSTSNTLTQLLTLEPKPEQVPIPAPSDELRQSIRKMLRFGGFKASGRSKPASEYLVRASLANELSSINPAVDALNGVSLHSGIPISVVDSQLLQGEQLRIDIAQSEDSYVFNSSGQEMSLNGLVCLYDQMGPCANPVKDSQRTKTHDRTTQTLTIFWGSQIAQAQTIAACQWYQELLCQLSAQVQSIEICLQD